MSARTVVMTLVLCFVGATVCFADDVQMGSWKLNEAKSKFAPGATKNNTVVVETAGDQVKVTVEDVNVDPGVRRTGPDRKNMPLADS